MAFKIVDCDNCRHSLYVEPGYVKVNCKMLHAVCPVCFQPMETPNPFYEEVK